jgi:hypothetical protein
MNELVEGVGIEPIEIEPKPIDVKPVDVKTCEAVEVCAIGPVIIGQVDDLAKPIMAGEAVVGFEKKEGIVGYEKGDVIRYVHPDVRIADLPETVAGDSWKLTIEKNGTVVSATEYAIDPRALPEGQVAHAVAYLNFVNDVPAKE